MLEPPRRSSPFESLYRAPDNPLRSGQNFRTGELSSSVLHAVSGVFTKARFELDADLETSNVCLLVWKAGRLQRLPLPPVGQGARVAYERGPMGL